VMQMRTIQTFYNKLANAFTEHVIIGNYFRTDSERKLGISNLEMFFKNRFGLT